MKSPVGSKREKGLWEHRWNCIKCDKSWFLSVDMSKERDRQRLDTFYSAVSVHVMNKEHSVGHIEKEKKFNVRYY